MRGAHAPGDGCAISRRGTRRWCGGGAPLRSARSPAETAAGAIHRARRCACEGSGAPRRECRFQCRRCASCTVWSRWRWAGKGSTCSSSLFAASDMWDLARRPSGEARWPNSPGPSGSSHPRFVGLPAASTFAAAVSLKLLLIYILWAKILTARLHRMLPSPIGWVTFNPTFNNSVNRLGRDALSCGKASRRLGQIAPGELPLLSIPASHRCLLFRMLVRLLLRMRRTYTALPSHGLWRGILRGQL